MKNAGFPCVFGFVGLVSLCMDLSSEMIHSLRQVFLVSVLGASTITLGLIEGIAEGTASISKVFSGVLSDRWRRRKPLVLFGYGLAALSKPFFPIAQSASWVLGATFADRIGKGIRGAPRDALIADATQPEIRGAAFGLRQSLDTAGALFGPLAAVGLMAVFAGNIRNVFWVAVVPAFIAVLVLGFAVVEPERHVDQRARPTLPRWHEMHRYGSAFWMIVVAGALFTLARFSEAFLVLRASQAGLADRWVPFVLVVMNVTYVLSAYPAGWLSDHTNRTVLLLLGLVVLVVADIVLAAGGSLTLIFVGIAVWGLHLGLTQGVFSALVADTAPTELRGSAFGIFNLVSGLVAIPASVLAGALWKWQGPAATFITGGVFSAVALVVVFWWTRQSIGSQAKPPAR